MSETVIALHSIAKVYGTGDAAVVALAGVNLHVVRGEYVAIMGASGSGKSTLMNIIGCLDTASSGQYILDGHDVSDLDEDALALVRNRMIGFVFQSFHLIGRMTAQANVELPMTYGGVPAGRRRDTARRLLDVVGLSDRAGHRPNELSGGQQQRVALARALTMNPSLILADEPTGNLDSTASQGMLRLLDALNADGTTIVLITHEEDVAAHAGRIIRIRDGQVVNDSGPRILDDSVGDGA